MQDPSVRVGASKLSSGYGFLPSYSSDSHYTSCSPVPVTWITQALIYDFCPIV